MDRTRLRWRLLLVGLCLIGLLPIGATANASPAPEVGDEPRPEDPEPGEEKPRLIGDEWRNGRAEVDVSQGLIGQVFPKAIEWLAARGIQLFSWYMISLQGNTMGGVDQAFRYTGLWDFGIDLDMETMAKLKGFWIHVSGSYANGKDLTTDVGAYAPVNAVFSGDAIRLFELYVEQRLFRDRLSIRAGRLTIGWEYGLEYDYFTKYMSAVFRLNVFALDANDPNFSVIPYANWGARVRWTPNANWRVQASWMNGYPRDFADDNKHGVDFTFKPREGSFFIVEVSYQWVPTKDLRKESPDRLPGRVSFGGYYDTGTFDLLDGSGNTAKVLGSTYVLVRQKLWEPELASDRGITVWSSFVFGGKQSIVPIRYFWSGGMKWTGPFRRLPKDDLAFGFAAEFFSDALVDQTVETVLEAAYSFNVTTWLTIMPDIQYIIRPSGMQSIDNALLAGVLLYLTF
ncbi:MAG: carbohydrate porin [Polyangiales bacterium]